MDKKHQLTESLKVIETQIHNDKIDLKGISSKLNIAYTYEQELNERMIYAKNHTEELRKEFFVKAGSISAKYGKMKEIFDVYTGNFYLDK